MPVPQRTTAARRRLLQWACGAALLQRAASCAAAQAFPDLRVRQLQERPRQLWVTRPDAQESARVVYWADSRIQWEGYSALNRLYRDVHANVLRPMHIGLLDLNYFLQEAVGRLYSPRPLILLSGYRTPATNALVGGVVPNVHGAGQADDFYYEGLSLHENYRLARSFQVGGLGMYPDRGFLHKDAGPLRSWVTTRP